MPSYLDKFKSYDANYNRIPQNLAQAGPAAGSLPEMPAAMPAPAQAAEPQPTMQLAQGSPFDDILNDQDFIGLPEPEKLKVMSAIDPDFAGLPPQEQSKALQMMAGPAPQPEDTGIDAAMAGRLSDVKSGEWFTDPQKRSRIYRPVLEGAGMLAGGVTGAVAGLPTTVGAVATGAALAGTGYAIGSNAADWLDYWSGVSKEAPTGAKAYKKAAEDVETGAAYDIGGQIFTAALMPVANGVSYVFNRSKEGLKTLIKSGSVETKAGKILVSQMAEGPMAAKNIQQAREIEKLINEEAGPNDPKIKFSWAQLTDVNEAIKGERALVAKPGTAANVQQAQIANNSAALSRFYDKNFGGREGVDDLLEALSKRRADLQARAAGAQESAQDLAGAVPRTSPAEAGRQITGEIESAQAPYKSAMDELEKQIPDYPMRFSNTQRAIDEKLASRKISDEQRQALDKFKVYLEDELSRGSTTYAAFGVRRTLNGRISKAFREGDDQIGRILMKVKAGVDSDLADVATMARSGKIMDYRGKAVDVDQLAGTLERNSQQIAKLKGTTKPDTAKMFDELRGQGGMSGTYMRQVKESEEAYTGRLTAEYERVFGKPSPAIEDAGTAAQVARMEAANDEIKGILAEVNPGQDVASLMKAYNDFASSEYFSRFGTTSVKGVLQKGAQSTGKKIAAESVPAKFLTESGSEDLIRAIGQEKAAGIMKGHFAYDMWQSARNSVTGKLEGKSLARWYNQNSEMLKKFGIADDFNRVKSAQAMADEAGVAAAQFEKTAATDALAADPERAIAAAIKGNKVGKAAKQLLDTVKGNKAAEAGLRKSFADHIRKEFMATQTEFIKSGVVKNNAFQKVIAKYQPAIDVLYKDAPKQAKALDTMRRAYEVLVRNTKSPIGGGSDTTEKLFGIIADKIHISRTVAGIKMLAKAFKKVGQQQTDAVLTQAYFHPEYAETLISAIKGDIPANKIEQVINKKIVDLNEYRQAKMSKAAAAGILGTVGNDNSDDRLLDR